MQFFEGQLPSHLSSLPLQAREELAHLLLASEDDPIAISPELVRELYRRSEEIDAGGVPMIDAYALLANLRKKYT